MVALNAALSVSVKSARKIEVQTADEMWIKQEKHFGFGSAESCSVSIYFIKKLSLCWAHFEETWGC